MSRGFKRDCWRPLQLSDAVLPGSCSQCRPESLYRPAYANDPLREEVLRYASWGLAVTTNRAYTSGERWFVRFCLMNCLLNPDGDVLPASEGTLIYFASYLARTVCYSTIKLYLATMIPLRVSFFSVRSCVVSFPTKSTSASVACQWHQRFSLPFVLFCTHGLDPGIFLWFGLLFCTHGLDPGIFLWFGLLST